MLEIVSLIILLIFGLALILAEILFVPGTTIVGLAGLLVSCIGIYLSFLNYGITTGWIVLVCNVVLFMMAFVYGLKANVWKNLSLNTAIQSRFNSEVPLRVKVGDIGTSLSDLRPIGKAEFNEEIIEVKTKGTFVKAGEKIKIVKLDPNNIFVEILTI